MTALRRVRAVLSWLLLAAVAVVWFVYLRPPVLGGGTSYVFVRGTSMEPTYHTGDLVVVRKQGRYRVGDIAAFAVPSGSGRRAVVVHRVVAADDDRRYTLQGDNRHQADPWHPSGDQIVGRPILLLPGVGRWLADLAARPILLGLLCGSAAAAVTISGRSRPGERTLGEASGVGS